MKLLGKLLPYSSQHSQPGPIEIAISELYLLGFFRQQLLSDPHISRGLVLVSFADPMYRRDSWFRYG